MRIEVMTTAQLTQKREAISAKAEAVRDNPLFEDLVAAFDRQLKRIDAQIERKQAITEGGR